jgi:Domain of Unknown Function (DUF1080)
MKRRYLSLPPLFLTGLFSALVFSSFAQMDPAWLGHDRLRPQPAVVDPGQFSTQDQVGKAPSDAVVLFDGKDLSQWVAMDGTPTKWVVKNNAMECVPGSGYIRTLQNFGDCQLHVEFATPAKPEGEGQARGNSGVFFGMDRYEVQILDSYANPTYADGSAGSVYGQYPPLVNASRRPGQWQTYDILYSAPRFDTDGKLVSPARLTVLHNGVLIQNNVELTGPTSWLQRTPYRAHPEKLPIALQDHGNPIRFRNVWIRELSTQGRHEFTYGSDVLNQLTGTYEIDGGLNVEIANEDNQLVARFQGVLWALYAASKTHFFAKTTDVQIEFLMDGMDKALVLSVGEGGMKAKKIR